MSYNELDLIEAYNEALRFTKSHYENFPVISIFVQNHLKKHIAVVYQFARQADDIADEGNMSKEERIAKLNEYEESLRSALNLEYSSAFWFALKNTIQDKKLSEANFFNLIKAFKQDIVKKRYKTFDDVLSYCRNSADPVGRVILELNGITDTKAKEYSDMICTGLQLTNFYQDVSVDYKKDRIYISEDEMNLYEISEKQFENKDKNDKFERLMIHQIERVRQLFIEGRNLLKYLPGMLRFQIAWTILGGEAILSKIEEIGYDTLNFRPTLSKTDMIKLLLKSWKM